MRIAGRLAVALVWLYNGLWCKLLSGCPHHREVTASMPGWLGGAAGPLLLGIGAVETLLAVWVLTGYRPRLAAATQTALLVMMNAGGLIWGRKGIADPAGMILQNLVFLTLLWTVATAKTPKENAPD